MAADYPGAIYSPRTKENRSGVDYDANKKTVIFAEDISKDDAEIVAIETELGLLPKGAYASVKARLDALAAKSIFDKFLDMISAPSMDGFDTSIDGAGSINPRGTSFMISTDQPGAAGAYMKQKGYYSAFIVAGKEITIDWVIYYLEKVTTQNAFLHLTKTTAMPPTETEHHVGFKLVNGDLYASSGDGSVQEITDTTINLASGNQFTRLKVVLLPGTNAKFYVNGVLKATHTTRLPTQNYTHLNMGIATTDAFRSEIELGRVLIERES